MPYVINQPEDTRAQDYGQAIGGVLGQVSNAYMQRKLREQERAQAIRDKAVELAANDFQNGLITLSDMQGQIESYAAAFESPEKFSELELQRFVRGFNLLDPDEQAKRTKEARKKKDAKYLDMFEKARQEGLLDYTEEEEDSPKPVSGLNEQVDINIPQAAGPIGQAVGLLDPALGESISQQAGKTFQVPRTGLEMARSAATATFGGGPFLGKIAQKLPGALASGQVPGPNVGALPPPGVTKQAAQTFLPGIVQQIIQNMQRPDPLQPSMLGRNYQQELSSMIAAQAGGPR